MSSNRPSRREVFEKCIVRGLLVACIPMSQAKLLAWWQNGERAAARPTPADVLGPFYKKQVPNTPNLRVPGDAGFPLHVSGKVVNRRDLVDGARVEVWHADHHGANDVKGYRYRAALTPDAFQRADARSCGRVYPAGGPRRRAGVAPSRPCYAG